MKRWRDASGQQISEYAVMLGVVILASMAAQRYVTRAVAGGLRSASVQMLGTNYADTATTATHSSSTTSQDGQPGLVSVASSSSSSGSSSSGFLLANPYNPNVGTYFPDPNSSMADIANQVASLVAAKSGDEAESADFQVGQDGWMTVKVTGRHNTRKHGPAYYDRVTRTVKFKVKGVSTVDGVWVAELEMKKADGSTEDVTVLGLPQSSLRGFQAKTLDEQHEALKAAIKRQRRQLEAWLPALKEFADALENSLNSGDGVLATKDEEGKKADRKLLTDIRDSIRGTERMLKRLDSKNLDDLSGQDVEQLEGQVGETYANGVLITNRVNGRKEDAKTQTAGKKLDDLLLSDHTQEPSKDPYRNPILWNEVTGKTYYEGDPTDSGTGWLTVYQDGEEVPSKEPAYGRAYGNGDQDTADSRIRRAYETIDRLEGWLDDNHPANEKQIRTHLKKAKEALDHIGGHPEPYADRRVYNEKTNREDIVGEDTQAWIKRAKEGFPTVGKELDTAYGMVGQAMVPVPDASGPSAEGSAASDPALSVSDSVFDYVKDHPIDLGGQLSTFDGDNLPDYWKDQNGNYDRMQWRVATDSEKEYIAKKRGKTAAPPAVSRMPIKPLTGREMVESGKSPTDDRVYEPHLWIPGNPPVGGKDERSQAESATTQDPASQVQVPTPPQDADHVHRQ